MKILFLGTGASFGIPGVCCKCSVCKSSSPLNKRLRSSILLKKDGKNILIDAAPDMRRAALKYDIDKLDAVLLTHYHDDHVAGLSELRAYYYCNDYKPMPLVASQITYQSVSMRYEYLMKRFDPLVLKSQRDEDEVCGIKFKYFTFYQEGVSVTGYRFDDFAYITDIKDYDEGIFEDLSGVKTLVISCLSEEGTDMHFSLKETIAFAKKAGAERCYLTHISHEIDHEDMSKRLPKNFELAYDGMEIDG